MKRKHFSFFIAFLKFSSLLAQTASYPETEFNKKFVCSFAQNTRQIAVSPLSWDTYETLAFLGTTGIGTMLYFHDEKLFRDFPYREDTWAVNLEKYLAEPFGNAFYLTGFSGLLYAYGHLAENSRAKATALVCLKGIIINGAFTQGFKYLFNRERPQLHSGFLAPHEWHGLFHPEYYNSFPSGHSSTAFTFASILAGMYADKPWVGVITYSLAGIASISRVYGEKHWPSDVFIGAALGYGIGKLILRNAKKKPPVNKPAAFTMNL